MGRHHHAAWYLRLDGAQFVGGFALPLGQRLGQQRAADSGLGEINAAHRTDDGSIMRLLVFTTGKELGLIDLLAAVHAAKRIFHRLATTVTSGRRGGVHPGCRRHGGPAHGRRARLNQRPRRNGGFDLREHYESDLPAFELTKILTGQAGRVDPEGNLDVTARLGIIRRVVSGLERVRNRRLPHNVFVGSDQ
jgi:hypothetical protein